VSAVPARQPADRLVDGEAFGPSTNDDDWLGHGIYFWEYAPQQAWWWAKRRYGEHAAVVGALVRLGFCLDLLDPSNAALLRAAHRDLERSLRTEGQQPPKNANNHKYLDCAVFNWLYRILEEGGRRVETCRAVFVPSVPVARMWDRSGVFQGAHIQLCVREPNSIAAVWPVRQDARCGKDK
jgi:hypothetical protein